MLLGDTQDVVLMQSVTGDVHRKTPESRAPSTTFDHSGISSALASKMKNTTRVQLEAVVRLKQIVVSFVGARTAPPGTQVGLRLRNASQTDDLP